MKLYEPVLSFGVDPDTKRFAMAAVKRDQNGALELSRVFHYVLPSMGEHYLEELVRLAGPLRASVQEDLSANRALLVTVENQEIYLGGKAAPKNIVSLAQAAGAQAFLALHALKTHANFFRMPSPKEWIGQVPKEIKQTRTFSRLGLAVLQRSGYVVPVVPEHLRIAPDGEWKHMGDAVGLALWGIEKFDRERAATRAARSQ